MENLIIILIDAESRDIRLYGKITRVIPFSNAFILPSLIAGQDVIYITGLQIVPAEDVINVLTYIITEEDQAQEKLYIRSKQEGYVRIPEIKMVFSGPKDAKPIENYGWDLFDRSGTLRKLLLEDKVEILTESQSKALRKHRPDPRSKDKALDSILLKGSVKSIVESENMFGPMGDDEGGDGDEVSGDEKEEVLSENEKILRDHRNFGKDRNQDA